ncbi:MAG: AmmeMemoRadiSam system protein B [Candidatus Omnitrophica bacterium]|nr:AmmeMemoRadiSam system protein B [Candidatus Omnitrophota bacterium]
MKNPNVAGQFYDSNPSVLRSNIENFISQAAVKPYDVPVDVIIAPHAGYVFSGQVAAYSYKAASKTSYQTVVVIAASHYFGFNGISIWPESAFLTPLGKIEVDSELAKKIMDYDPAFRFEPKVFEKEHSLEVQLPFAQVTFKDFRIVPILIGQPDYSTIEKLAQALKNAIGDRKDVLIVASTDMSHYHEDNYARKIDTYTLDAVRDFNVKKIWEECGIKKMEMCGFMPVVAALLYAKERGAGNIDILNYANSGDVTGDKGKVVGYYSAVIYGGSKLRSAEVMTKKRVNRLTYDQKNRLIQIAKTTIKEYVERGKVLDIKEEDPRLLENEGAFVTAHKYGQLRGCIGHIIAVEPLYLTVRDMAIAAVSQDTRFDKVRKEELPYLEIEISVLSKPWVIDNIDEVQLGVHGVIVSKGVFNHGVYLPQVAKETGWNREQFLSSLCTHKAGLPADCWKDPLTKIEIFTAEVFSETDIK